MKNAIYFLISILLGSSPLFSRQIIVNTNHPKATDRQECGSNKKPFKTMNRAASVAEPGDTIIVYGGIYREWVVPVHAGTAENPIVYRAARDEQVIVKGSEIWKNSWNGMSGCENVYHSPLDLTLLKEYNPYYIPLARMDGRLSLGQIFVNGERYVQVDSLSQVTGMPGTWMLSYDSAEIILHFNAKKSLTSWGKSLVEFTVRERIFSPKTRGLSYITVEGFVFEHAANQFPSGFYNRGPKGFPQAGAVSTRAGHHWTIQKNIIRYANSLGIDCGYGGINDTPEGTRQRDILKNDTIGYHCIENNIITDCGSGGIAGAYNRETRIRNNIIERCNYLNIGAPETGGIKVHFFYNSIIEGNLIRDNNCNGIWLDNEWYGSRVSRNVVLNCSGQGIFVELGNGDCLVDNNIVAYTKLGDGIYLHDASGVTIAHNLLFANQHFGFYARIVSERGKSVMQDLRILNNIFIDNYRGHMCLPPEDGNKIKNNQSDYNLFINGTQWQWEGLDYNSFTLGSNDRRVPKDTLASILKRSLNKNGVPVPLQPNYDVWKEQPFLGFEWWQMVTGYDLHSYCPKVHTGEVENGAIDKGAFSLSQASLFLDIKNGNTFTQLKVPSMAKVNKDFFGNPLPVGLLYPGPFQNYQDGFNRIFFIP